MTVAIRVTEKKHEDHPQYRYEPVGIFHSSKCPHKETNQSWHGVETDVLEPHADCTEFCQLEFDEFAYEGATLCTRERNFYHDSDFYAVVWDEVEAKTRVIEYGTTRFPTYHNRAGADATKEIQAKASEYNYGLFIKQCQAANVRQSRQIATDRRVKVVKGRKVPIGTEGIVKWTGMGNYRNMRARIETDEGEEHWIDCSNLEVIEPEQWLRPEATVKQHARKISTQWHLPYVPDRMLVI